MNNKEVPLFVHPKNDYTGSSRVLANVIETDYPDKNVKVICLNPHGRGFLSDLPNVEIVPLPYFTIAGKPIRLLTRKIYSFACKKTVKKYAKEYDTVYLNTILASMAASTVHRLGKRIIWHVHEKFINITPAIKTAERIFSKTPAHRIFVSNYLKDCYPASPGSTYEIRYNALPASFLGKVSVVPVEQRDRNKILMISSLTKAKGIDTFIEVAKRLPNYIFTLIISSDEHAIENFFCDMEIPANCSLVPSQSDIHSWMRENSLILNLSNPALCIETFGMTILEGMAYGIPAVVPNVGGPVELVKDGVNGRTIDTRKVKEIIKAIVDITGSYNNYQKYALNALEASKKFL